MSRRRGAHKISPPQPSTVVVEILLMMAELDEFAGSWKTMDDVARIIQSIYELPHSMKITSELINSQLCKDPCTASSVDSRDMNSTGIFRDHYNRRPVIAQSNSTTQKVRCLFLCKTGVFPPKPTPGNKWSDEVDGPLPTDWMPPRKYFKKPPTFINQREMLKKLLQASTSSTTQQSLLKNESRKKT